MQLQITHGHESGAFLCYLSAEELQQRNVEEAGVALAAITSTWPWVGHNSLGPQSAQLRSASQAAPPILASAAQKAELQP